MIIHAGFNYCLMAHVVPQINNVNFASNLRAMNANRSMIHMSCECLGVSPLSVHCAQGHGPQVGAEFGQLGDVVCNLEGS